jgi:hypothetical protein
MRRRSFLTRSEHRALDLLERSLAGTGWHVYSKVRLCDVIEPSPGEHVTSAEDRMLRMGHLDFVVIDRAAGGLAEFAIEFDGPSHESHEQRARDRVKDWLLDSAGLPLLRIDTEDLAERDQFTMLEWAVERFIAHHRWATDWHAYEGDSDAFSRNVLEFDLQHTFPGIRAVIRRLFDRYGIVCANWWVWGGPKACLAPLDKAPLQVFPEPGYLWALTLLDGGFLPPAERPSGYFDETGLASLIVVRPNDDAIVFRAEGRLPPPLALHPLSGTEVTRSYMFRGSEVHAILGLEYGEMRATLAEYLALREVERWAGRALVPLAA